MTYGSGSDGGERVALVFPGQGAQRPAMGEPWRDTPYWGVVESLSEAVGRDLAALLTTADAEELRRTDNAQLATFTLEMVVLAAVRDRAGELPVARTAGHSLGEYSALVAAGVLGAEEAGRVVAERGAAMADAARRAPGTMAVLLGGDTDGLRALVEEERAAGRQVWVANLNAPGQTVISGTVEGVDAVAARAGEQGARVARIPVGGAFHSPLMDSAQPRLAAAWAAVTPGPGRVPVVTNVDGTAHRGPDVDWRDLAVRQLTAPVRWEHTVRTLADAGCTRFVELGPGQVLTGLARRIAPAVSTVSVSTPDQLTAVGRELVSA
ncbi:ACP S-malonyltransferase [Streptomyces sp. L2]|uniref:ACP S-malonyltransferase n=1 Tax=Streptomyces sp. L2 TaxID=2162665 RepID=UPI0010120976|nr:ACP S-malonyltransferase [Streptomyces sp. L2]